MIHGTRSMSADVVIMWCEPREKNEQIIKFVAKCPVENGDVLSVGTTDYPAIYTILEVVEKRKATVKGYDYLTCKALRQNVNIDGE